MSVDTVTLSAGGTSVTMTGDAFDRAVNSYPIDIPDAGAFEDANGYLDAPEIEVIGQALIADDDNELSHCELFRIVYCWQEKASKRAGKPLYGTITRPGKLARHLSDGVDFVVCLGADALAEIRPSRELITSIVYHQLLHIAVDEETGKPSLRGPDVAFFFQEVERRGLWTHELKQARMQLDQLPLPFQQGRKAS